MNQAHPFPPAGRPTAGLPFTGLPRTGLPPRALTVDDPQLAEHITHRLTDVREVAGHREYRAFAGAWNDTEIVVACHGAGAPGAIRLYQELMDAGADTIIKLGSAAALLRGIGPGDLIMAESCVRDDGVTGQLVPAGYPAAAGPEVVLALAASAHRQDAPHHRGIVWSRAASFPGIVDLNQAGYVSVGVLALEMDLAALLVLASTRGVRAGGCLVIEGAGAVADPAHLARGASVALDALVGLPDA
ncbi:nucleoside phosphorylase [Cryobacterium sp. PAMC25264]|uniref:nucleoside phosphorylase n=1 Tax=Cryobacterium sp. PAMC25264 TaxID=2861288 RepID=UPI001C638B48|nr:hypothetical protein [Cryobacterium sp. PAMC25264]QYF73450.1 hypothetical protein KY500_17335 [Cryobacterium sp. PAMC25264]